MNLAFQPPLDPEVCHHDRFIDVYLSGGEAQHEKWFWTRTVRRRVPEMTRYIRDEPENRAWALHSLSCVDCGEELPCT